MALRKVRGLLAAGARVHVIAVQVAGSLKALPEVSWEERAFRSEDLVPGNPSSHCVVIAATEDRQVNRQVYQAAHEAGVPVNTVDDPELCDFTLPAVIRQGRLLVTVSSSGESPAVSAWLRRRLQAALGPEYDELIRVVGEVRQELHDSGHTTEGLDWQYALDSGILEMIREGRLSEAKERLQACLL